MDTDAQPAPITTADAPFDDPTDSVDLVIRTANRVDFFVLSALLSLRSSSSFFRQILPRNADTEEREGFREGFPVLEVEEDSDTFRTILLLCYPYVAPEIQSVQQFRAVGVALDKYRMDCAMERFVQAVLASAMISKQPLRVFAVAVANGWKKLGEAAARNILATPFSQAISDVEELNEISTHNLLRLEEYHVQCGYAAQIRIRGGSLSWLRGKTSSLFFLHRTPHCRWCGVWNNLFDLGYADAPLLRGHAWLTDTYFGLVNSKLVSVPWPQVALDDDIVDQTIFASTRECEGQWEEMAGSQIRCFGKIVAEEIDKRVSKVPLNIEWPNEHQNEKDGSWDVIWKVFGRKSGSLLRLPPCNLSASIASGAAKLHKFRQKFSHQESL
ncbi:hypothetical protein IW261DRAFT_151848 [Armillaria novae-zelandiae]|uniref:BTB domain-containing protein n=1 Tax=Armillaria novae-zelandiae TaxID=153914 RepID=A0AA39U884_9AGAR|nr:hypothetical protein IW261DRAFT_151848 [Armillaria novae-zelandiae]